MSAKELFGLEGVEHELIENYQPKFLAIGGEHVVYEIPDHPDIVAKVEVMSLKDSITWNDEHGEPMGVLSEEFKAQRDEYIKLHIEKYQQLKKYFGNEHVLPQKEFLLKVPVPPNVLRLLYDEKPPLQGTETWSVAKIQRRAAELSDQNRLSLVAGNAELENLNAEEYNRVTEHLVFGKDSEMPLKENELLDIQSKDDLKKLLEQAENDDELMVSLRELLKKIVIYTNETGDVIDIIGKDNLVFTRKDGKWTYRLVDPLYPGDKKIVSEAKAVLLKLSKGIEFNNEEHRFLMHTFNIVRTVNGLAEQVGIPERIDIVPEDMEKKDMDYWALLKKKLPIFEKTETNGAD